MEGKHAPNNLIYASSPYLLQHAYNPVQWYEWGESAINKAQQENKPIILSIGYSSCHWCHVMEENDFEDEEIARVMNQYFVPVKVDREERPDNDQLYMEAAQIMGMGGGWPLNVFLTPDKKPFYAGTYFPPDRWMELLKKIAQAWQDQQKEIRESADKFGESLQVSELQRFGLEPQEQNFTQEDLHKVYQLLSGDFDRNQGGMNRAPKFPLPIVYEFLFRYYTTTYNTDALNHVDLTLSKMAMGGIYDQAGGGFARYSTDEMWFVPHFEKMLYDNAQLLSLYSEAYQVTGKELYKEVVEETIEFIKREMTGPNGGFFSALDADSEGEEGKFYVWDYHELESLLEDDLELFCDYYSISQESNWENGNILYRKESDETFAKRHNMALEDLKQKVRQWKHILLNAREDRTRPALDDKILTSWNALMLKGCVDAYRVFQREDFLELAEQNARFLEQNLYRGEGQLFHNYKDGKASIPGYLEDYAQMILALRNLYEVTFHEKWLWLAETLTEYTLKNFFDDEEEMFFFTDAGSEQLIARKKELLDNVIPSSNSVMANNLFFMGALLGRENYTSIARNMVNRMSGVLFKNPQFLGNWACLLTCMVTPTLEVAIVGKNYQEYRKQLEKEFYPNMVIMGTDNGSRLPLLQNRNPESDQTTVYVCQNHTCQLPVTSVEEALQQIHELQEQ